MGFEVNIIYRNGVKSSWFISCLLLMIPHLNNVFGFLSQDR